MSVTRSAETDKQLLAKNGFNNGVDIKAGITGTITVFQYNGEDPAILPLCVDGYIMVKILNHAVNAPDSVAQQAKNAREKYAARDARLSYFNECKILAELNGKGRSAHAAVVRLGNDESGQYEFIINKPIFSNINQFTKKAAKIKDKFDNADKEEEKETKEAIAENEKNIKLLDALVSAFVKIEEEANKRRIKSENAADRRSPYSIYKSSINAALEYLKNAEADADALSDDVTQNLSKLGIDSTTGKYLIEILHREFDEDGDIKEPALTSSGMLVHLRLLMDEASKEINELNMELPGHKYERKMKTLLSNSFCNLEQCMRDMGNNGVDPRESFALAFNGLKEKLDNLHRDGVIHGDLGCRNAAVVLGGDEKVKIGDAVLIDFGLSRTFKDNKLNIQSCDGEPVIFKIVPSFTYDLASVHDQTRVTPSTDDFMFKFMQMEAIALYCGVEDTHMFFMENLQSPSENARDIDIVSNNDNETRINNAVSNLEEKIRGLCAIPDKAARKRGEYAQALLSQCKAELLSLPQELKDQKIAVKVGNTKGILKGLRVEGVSNVPVVQNSGIEGEPKPKTAAPAQDAEDIKMGSTAEPNTDKQIEERNQGSLSPRK